MGSNGDFAQFVADYPTEAGFLTDFALRKKVLGKQILKCIIILC